MPKNVFDPNIADIEASLKIEVHNDNIDRLSAHKCC